MIYYTISIIQLLVLGPMGELSLRSIIIIFSPQIYLIKYDARNMIQSQLNFWTELACDLIFELTKFKSLS